MFVVADEANSNLWKALITGRGGPPAWAAGGGGGRVGAATRCCRRSRPFLALPVLPPNAPCSGKADDQNRLPPPTPRTPTPTPHAPVPGPEGTPYCGGCFLFDIYFPPDYPRIPPRVDIRTTGGGSVRVGGWAALGGARSCRACCCLSCFAPAKSFPGRAAVLSAVSHAHRLARRVSMLACPHAGSLPIGLKGERRAFSHFCTVFTLLAVLLPSPPATPGCSSIPTCEHGPTAWLGLCAAQGTRAARVPGCMPALCSGVAGACSLQFTCGRAPCTVTLPCLLSQRHGNGARCCQPGPVINASHPHPPTPHPPAHPPLAHTLTCTHARKPPPRTHPFCACSYQDGKVCLSLLGTWRGGRGESWSAEYSTVLQVLISIQVPGAAPPRLPSRPGNAC